MRTIGSRLKTKLGVIAAMSVMLPAWAPARPAAGPPSEAVEISVGGGAVDSAAFRWSSAIAEILSRPPGLPNCDPSGPCGVPGVVAVAQTYDDPTALLVAASEGRVTTAILPALQVFLARCAPPKGQPPAPLWSLRILYRQPVQIVVRTQAGIASPKDFVGKTIAVGEAGSDSERLALAMLDAYGVPRGRVKLLRVSATLALGGLAAGTGAAAILIGHTFDTPIAGLIDRGGFTLLSLPDTPERKRLLAALPVFEADALPPGIYAGMPAISTLSQPVVWTAGPALDPPLAAKLVANMTDPHNAARLAELVEPLAPVPGASAFRHLPIPPSDGVAEFARAAGVDIDTAPCTPQPK